MSNEVWKFEKDLCRCCHSEGAFKNLSSDTAEEPPGSYCDILRNCLNIELSPVPEHYLPTAHSICDPCIARLLDAHSFKQQVITCEKYFLSLYPRNFKVADTEIKVELPDDPDFGAIHDDDDCDVDFPYIDEGQPKRESKRKKVKKKRLDKKLKHLTEVDDISDDIRPTASKRTSTPAYRLSPSDFERIGDSLKCTRCEKQFNSVNGLRFHVKSLHMNIAKYTCTLCAKTFRTLAPFTKHKLDEHSIDDRIKCNACDNIFNTRTQLVKHKNSFHMLGVKHACPHCDYECFSVEAMYKHKFKHKSVKDYQCRFCRKSFLRKTTLDLHERIHTGDRRKVCNECGQAFVQKASLNYHMAKYHPEVKF